MELSGAEIVIRSLQEEKVEHIFGYPGGAVLFIYDELFKQKKVKHILVRHEQGAAHAADAYARATGKPGVCLVTSGPGITNAVTGIATAYMDSIPLVVISDKCPNTPSAKTLFKKPMRWVLPAHALSITLWCNGWKISRRYPSGFPCRRSGRPGPVVVDIPKDITAQKTEFSYPKGAVKMRSYNPVSKGHPGQIKRALKLIKSAKRLMVYTGGGVILSNASAELTRLVRKLKCPVTNTLMGLGAFPGDDKQFLGMPGMHGTYETNMAMQYCDVLLAVGARFDDRVIGNPAHFAQVARKIIHVDIDPSSISKRVKVDVPIVGDVLSVLKDMNKLLPSYLPNAKT